MDEFFLCSLVSGNQRNACGGLRVDTVASDGQLAIIQCDTEVVNRISWKTLRHGRDDNALVTFTEHAGLGDGFALLQRGTEINAAEQPSLWNIGGDFP